VTHVTDLHGRIQALRPEKRAQLERMLAERAARASLDQPIRARHGTAIPLSVAQHREWLTEQSRPSNNMRGAVRITGRLDPDRLRRVLREIVMRHEVMRTNVEPRSGTPVAVAQARVDELDVALVDLSGMRDRDAEVDRLLLQEARRPFDVARDVLLRGLIIRLAAEEHVLLLTIHRMASDGWSQSILLTELASLLEAARTGTGSPLAPPPLQYADFSAWQRDQLDRGGFDRHVEYWRTQLTGRPPRLALTPGRPSFTYATYRHSLPASTGEGIDRLVKRLHASPFMVLLAALKTLVYRLTGQTDVVVSAPIAGRNRPELEPVFGCFVNILLLRTRIRGADTFRELLTKVRTTTLDGYEHQDLPYEHLIDEPRPDPPRLPLMFNADNLPLSPIKLTGLTLTPVPVDSDGVDAELTLLAQRDADGTRLVWQYDTGLFEPATIVAHSRQLAAILAQVVAIPDIRLDDIPLERWDDVDRPTP
jgi:Condensation domain